MYRMPDVPTCERGNDLIAFLYSEMDEEAARNFERHVMNCPSCESELGAFNQIRSSVVDWRQRTVGAVTATLLSPSPAVDRASDRRKSSAMAAFRGFFDLSPLWMKSSMAIAAVLFCLVSALALVHLFEDRKPVVAADEKRYTEKDLQSKIEDAIKSRVPNPETEEGALIPPVTARNNQQVKPRTRGTNRSTERVAPNPKVARRPLTKSEREQLAADLRLILPQDDTDLDLLSDGINQ